MADLDTLRLNITANTEDASASLNSLTQSLTSLKQAMNSFKATKSLEKSLENISNIATGVSNAVKTLDIDSGFSTAVTDGLTSIVSAVNSVSDESIEKIERLGKALKSLPRINLSTTMGDANDDSAKASLRERMSAFGKTLQTGLSASGKGVIGTFKGISSVTGALYRAFTKGHKSSFQLAQDFARIAKYRAVRTVIKAITDGAKEGFKNLAHYSNEANAALSNLTTGSQYVSNSFAAALYPAIASVIGIFNSLINIVVRALNILNMFFSILGGKGTYIKATKQTKDYASALGGAGGAAKALKQELMGFDEINALTPSGGGGGGGGGGGLDYGSMFEEAPVESWLKDMIDSGDFSALGSKIAQKINSALGSIPWAKVYAGVEKAVGSLTSLLNGFIGDIDPNVIGETIAGVINAGALLVANFWNNTNWELLGLKVKVAIRKAISNINVQTLAHAITGKLNAAVRFLSTLLPTSAEGWKTVTDKIAELLKNIIEAIPKADIGGIIASLITGGLSLITSLGEAGTLTNITQAVVTAIKGAFSGVTKEDVKAAWDAVKGDVFGAIDLLADLKIKIGNFEFSAVGAMLTGTMLFGVLKSIVGNLFSVNGFRSGSKAFTLIAGISIMINAAASLVSMLADGDASALDIVDEIGNALVGAGFTLLGAGNKQGALISLVAGIAISMIASIGNIIKDTSISSGEKFLEILGEIGKGLVAAGFTLLVGGAGAPGAIVVSIGAAVYLVYDIFTEGANSDLFSEDLTQQIKDAAAAAAAATEPTKVVAEALSQLTGITIPESFILNNLDTLFAGTGLEDGSVEIGGLTDAMNAFVGAMQTATEQGNLDEFLSNLGLLGDTATDAEASVADATSGVTAAASDLQNKSDEMAESLSGYQTAAENASTAADTLATDIEGLPQVVILDNTAIADVESGAKEASTAVAGLVTEISNLQIKLAMLGVKPLFAPVSESASSAKTSIEALKTSVSGMPEERRIGFNLYNYSSAKSKIASLKKTLDSIGSKTISIKVKAGLTSGAKSFLNALKDVSSGTTATQIKNLLNFSQYAGGGFPKSGELFMANENGQQELVGRIGNQPAVANQDQIGDAIFRYMDAHSAQNGNGIDTEELATAIVRGIRASGLGTIKLDGKTISGSINRETQRSGKPAIQF